MAAQPAEHPLRDEAPHRPRAEGRRRRDACSGRCSTASTPATENDVAVDCHGRTFHVHEISSKILAKIRDVASDHLGFRVTRAVVTVPAYFTDRQRQAVKEAGTLIGLEVVRIINEPTAAALAYGVGKRLDERVLVYDLGGGTFDVSIIEIRDRVFEVKATGGDIFLGGIDFDNAMIDHVLDDFRKKHGIDLSVGPGRDAADQGPRRADQDRPVRARPRRPSRSRSSR